MVEAARTVLPRQQQSNKRCAGGIKERYLVKYLTLLVGFTLAQLVVAVPMHDFTTEKCQSSTTDKVFQCPEYVNECSLPALKKIENQARDQGAVVANNSFTVWEVDDRVYNLSKFVWFKAKGVKSDGTAIEFKVLTQKSYFPPETCY